MLARRRKTPFLTGLHRRGGRTRSAWDDAAPVRDELFSIERLEAHARSLAEAQGLGRKGRGQPLVRRLAENQALLLEAYRDTVQALDDGASITPAAEWLIDNFHLVEKQIREVRLDLPASYYRELPKIVHGHLAGHPRVFGIAWAFVAHTDSRFDPDLLCRFLHAYQEVQPLTIGELWAVAITLRIVLIENLRRIAERIMISRAARAEADDCCNRMLGVGDRPVEASEGVLGPYERAPLADAFAVQMHQRLREDDGAGAPALTWLDAQLSRRGVGADQVIRDEQQRQVAASGTVRNIVTSLRLISDVDWSEQVERVSLVDDVLKAGSAFADMDFPTRNLYRTAIEDLARGSGRSELDVARRLVQAIRAVDDISGEGRRCDPGYYLVAAGRNDFEASIGFRAPVRTWPGRAVRGLGIGAYVGAILAATALLLALPLGGLLVQGTGAIWLVVLGVLGAFPALDAAVALVNRGVTRGFRAVPLPALELKGGVPQRLRTLVAVPVLLTDAADVEAHVERLEIHYLSSPEGHLHFALLSDWGDAGSEQAEADGALLRAAAEGIARLNRKHGAAPGGDRFLLLHRRRVWSESEASWMGWERKRGKLHELNRLLRDARDTTFLPVANQVVPRAVRYVVTLDADTKLPRETVRRLIGKMAHPLNRPHLDAASGCVTEGYAVLQPRITPALPTAGEGSVFRRVFSSIGGIDPYAAAVSDVYQDLFGEGSFAGKGIYDVDAFEAALRGRIPDSTLLSHDLFEGIFARAGLASDVEVVEDFPDRYDVSSARHHRWARGDWQLLPWILGLPPAPGRASSPVPAIGRWKMVDNLRRTLSPGMSLASLWAGWLLPLPGAALWTLFVLLTFALPPLIPVAASLARRRPGVPLRARLHGLEVDLRLALVQAALVTTLLAHQAWLMGDAITRTLWRLLVSRRRLLEWVPAAQAAAGLRLDLPSFYRRMAPAVALGLATLGLVGLARADGWAVAAPFIAAWIASPAVALLASRPPPPAGRFPPSQADLRRLRLTARRTWRFFEAFVTAADNMLPPDNFQEDPEAVAHRTSPTNIGLYLLSVAVARDCGWLGTAEAAERLEATLSTMGRMARFRGHFYNWYATQDLRPLDPPYVSSVDSGNLAGHLIALANAAQQWSAAPLDGVQGLAGVADALGVLEDEADAPRRASAGVATWRRFEGEFDRMREALEAAGAAGPVTAGRWAGLAAQAARLADAAQAVSIDRGDATGADLLFWAQAVGGAIASHRRDFEVPVADRLAAIAETARRMALEMDFSFLLDPDRMLLSIGYRAAEGELDSNCYDLLGSEARLASFFAIAKGDAPARHWFRLGHAVTPVAHGAALISWSGSMFEYLMPSLVMRAPPGSLVDRTDHLVVRRQVEYAADLQVPWGMSESAYNARDLEFTYQYLSFGVPSLGLKRGLDDHVVVAPYATALAAMVDPKAAARNLEQLEALGARGRYGFYEALDYTPARVPDGQRYALVRAFMAHHQGMTIVAIANALSEGLMQARFHAEPMVQATELLLEERMPREVVISQPWIARKRFTVHANAVEGSGARRFLSPHTPTPAVHVLSNGSYSVMLTAAGSGYSRWGDVAVTRWREDPTCDALGSHIFLRDVRSGAVWSAGYQPTGAEPDDYHVTFNEDRCEIVRRDGSLITALDVLVSAEDDAEVRRVSITNRGFGAREIDVTSYAELALAPQAADAAHPAFSKLFVVTEHLPALGALLATRRRRSQGDPEVWVGQVAVLEGESVGRPEFSTDRAQILGRGHDIRAPQRVIDGVALGGATGTVLDPAFALRRRVRIAPGATARISFWTLAASSRKALLDLIDKHHDPAAFDRAANLAWTQALVQLHHLGADRGEAALFQRLAGHVIYATPELRAPVGALGRDAGGQPGLWRVGISGDLPIVLLRIADTHELGLARQLVKASEYWRAKGLAFDLVLLNERGTSYVQDLQVALEALVRAGQAHGDHGPAGRTMVLRADLVAPETRDLIAAVARVVLAGQAGSLSEQLDRVSEAGAPSLGAVRRRPVAVETSVTPTPQLEFFNGLGGFADDGREYVTVLTPGQVTPAPWINVIANPGFGFQVSTDGAGFTWARNSREHQLTPWSNDPVADPTGEALFLRDEETGELWCPTATPIRQETESYVARHGRGYSRFEHSSHGLDLELLQFVPLSDPVKVSRLRLRNTSGRARRLSVTGYVEWALGASRAAVAPFTITSADPVTGAILARNTWNPAFGAPVAFADLGGRQASWTGDRREFIGRNGALAAPAALVARGPLSGALGAGLDPCAALQAMIELPPGGTCEVLFLLGEGKDDAEAQALIARYRNADLEAVLAAVRKHWDRILGAVQVTTPDRSMDVMLNGWLLYQTLACRIWARSAFYQASGAYGFRDQLQDSMALVATEPSIMREHLLKVAARQFVEGDVQHWWLPHSGQGVRTRISDDRVWLAYGAAHYVTTAGDEGVLGEMVPFLEGAPLEAGEAERFFQPVVAKETASLYEHCARALDHSLDLGGHSLPLIGGGDWNDGMNRVGERGLGESVWLGWLLHSALSAFIPLAHARGDHARARSWQAHAEALAAALERHAWDGEWYRRGWFDDGAPLGSAASDECRIDSIAQSWAVLSGVAAPERAAMAMAAVERDLILEDEKLALLFTPAFDRTPLDPGYIKAYPPGLRENGGQYTHAAAWAVMALAALGEGDRAGALFAMLNPINHTRDRTAVHRYKVEPYVMAADVYAAPGHVGRGGWTWYTGSAAWMQRAGIESILGLRREGDVLVVDPCIPKDWPGFSVRLRHGASVYAIEVRNPAGVAHGVQSAELDGEPLAAAPLHLRLKDDGQAHRMTVRLGEPAAPDPQAVGP
ncbi:glucoamylase family protein [Phenylobacterium sp.]|uniref:GH36-type glycosyl hydrolase domain-containing protein n=1 Tax=Phenylobacterium sp. TaxID=1871053 RepID=UPI0025CE65F0|nr:glucoamylase family protein [Phenylobacterium sp.]